MHSMAYRTTTYRYFIVCTCICWISSFICPNLNPHALWILSAEFGKVWPGCSWEVDYKMFIDGQTTKGHAMITKYTSTELKIYLFSSCLSDATNLYGRWYIENKHWWKKDNLVHVHCITSNQHERLLTNF